MSQCLLIVTDEETTRDALTVEVSGLGVDVVQADSGEDALELLSQRQVDGVITGLKLHGMDGLTLLQRVHEIDDELPVIMVTA